MAHGVDKLCKLV